MEQIKPKVFVGSSREAIDYVDAVHKSLTYVAEVTPWKAGTFNPLDYTMEDLETQLDKNDFAVFIFSPDDIIDIRGTRYLITRDNTLFEMGLFWGNLRRGRVFYLIPDKISQEDKTNLHVEEYHLLSDLVGINPLSYEANRSDSNVESAVNTACSYITKKIKELGSYSDPRKLLEQAILRQEERDAVSLFTLKLTKELLSDNTKVYDYLTDALRSVYAIYPKFTIDGVGVWKREGTDGLKHISGKMGDKGFYPFNINDGKEENAGDRILVVDCFNANEEKIFLTKDHLFKTYLICYPIGEELVLTVTITGSTLLTDEETMFHIVANEELIKTINYLFGGASND